MGDMWIYGVIPGSWLRSKSSATTMSDASQPPVLEEAVRNAPPTDSNNRGNFTRNLNKEDDASVARKMFLGGLFLLPWLHLANVMFFRKQFMDANVDAQVTLWVRRSFMAFCFTSILFISWVLVFQLNWKEFGWAKLVMVLPPENLDVGW